MRSIMLLYRTGSCLLWEFRNEISSSKESRSAITSSNKRGKVKFLLESNSP